MLVAGITVFSPSFSPIFAPETDKTMPFYPIIGDIAQPIGGWLCGLAFLAICCYILLRAEIHIPYLEVVYEIGRKFTP